jgi:hypothetical protein
MYDRYSRNVFRGAPNITGNCEEGEFNPNPEQVVREDLMNKIFQSMAVVIFALAGFGGL